MEQFSPEKSSEKSDSETIFRTMKLDTLIEFINAAYKRREEMDLSYTLRLESDLGIAMKILNERTGYGVL